MSERHGPPGRSLQEIPLGVEGVKNGLLTPGLD